MNFTRRVKEELAAKAFDSDCCKLACISAFLRTSGSVVSDGRNIGFSFTTESASTAEYFKNLIETRFSLKPLPVAAKSQPADKQADDRPQPADKQPDVRSDNVQDKTKGMRGAEKEKITVEYIDDTTLGILSELGILSLTPEGVSVRVEIDKYLVEEEESKRAYIAGAFLGGGSCTLPSDEAGKRGGYHFEIVFSYYRTASDFAVLMAEFDILVKLISRKNTFVVYIKNNDEIQEALSLMGADNASHELAETVVYKDMNNTANRKRNCDLGNIDKQVKASEKQCAAIEVIMKTVGLDALPPELAALCRLRMKDSYLTYEEMAEELGISKSCVNHRMRRVMKIKEELSD